MHTEKFNHAGLKSIGLGVIGTQTSTIDCMNGLMRGGYRIEQIITLPPHLKSPVSDYQNLREFAENHSIPIAWVETYGMKDSQTHEKLKNIKLQIVVVVGWQRLIPEWFLDLIPFGVYGMHGSSLPLPKGRGRSPMNWSILEGKDRFYTYLFRYDSGVDSGRIIGCQRFDIYPWDTIQTLQHKNSVSQYKLLLKNITDILNERATLYPQDEAVNPSYYPMRTPEDGVIDWSQWTAREIFALVRAVTCPYPGAYTEYEGSILYIWNCAPFDSCIQYPDAKTGEIVEVFADGTFVVQCFVDTLIVLYYEVHGTWQPHVGQCLSSKFNASWKKLSEMKLSE
jgi:methionyl-tRNA formyltransferase